MVNSEHNEEMEKMMNVIDGIKNNITTINSTLSSNIIWIKEDLKKNNVSFYHFFKDLHTYILQIQQDAISQAAI